MKNQVVEGHVFIVPNQVTKLEDFAEPEWLMEKLRRLTGLKVNYEDEVIQVWVVSERCDNWSDTFAGFQACCGMEEFDSKTRDQRLMGYFPKYFPVKLFDKKMEGDEISLYCKEYDITIKLICDQLGYRYNRFGRFEDVYARLTN